MTIRPEVVTNLRRVSPVWPAPTLDVRGRPSGDWQPTSVLRGEWGKLQLIMGGVDVSNYRDVPVQIENWTSNEPFDDAVLEVKFPQITTFEALPAWAADYNNVELNLIRPDNSVKVLFEGMLIDEQDDASESEGGVALQVLGALYQADFFLSRPPIAKQETLDIGDLISDLLNPSNVGMASLRLGVAEKRWTGITYTKHGSWNPLLTGHIQEMLSVATASGQPAPGEQIIGGTPLPDGTGYLLTGTLGSVLPYGDAAYQGGMIGTNLNEPAARVAFRAGHTDQYWFAAADGGVFAFGKNAPYYGNQLGTADGPIIGIESSISGDGYLMASAGGGIYTFGDYPFGGTDEPPANTYIMDVGREAAGNGYWQLSSGGHVFSHGGAPYHGGGEGTGQSFRAMAVDPQGRGYWLLTTDGDIYAYGTGLPHFGDYGTEPENEEAIDIMPTGSGDGYWIVGADGGVFSFGDAPFHGSVPSRGGNYTQWTLMKEPGRVPVIKTKDVTTKHWHVTAGSPGVAHSLQRDSSEAYNVVYGSGTNTNQEAWRNTKYPTANQGGVPAFGGQTLSLGLVSPDVLTWKRFMYEAGYGMLTVDDIFDQAAANAARYFQIQAGLPGTGVVDAATWAATFQVGYGQGDPEASHFAPLSADPRTIQSFFNPKGAAIGSNPAFVASHLRREAYYNFGDMVTKNEGEAAAAQLWGRDDPATFSGSLTLSVDPEEGSRFEMKAGENIVLKSHRGVDRFLHIASVNVNWASQTVGLTVDERSRDALTLAAIRQRRRETLDPTRRNSPTYRNKEQLEDRRSVWDSESGAGIIPRVAMTAGAWKVLMIPSGTLGTVVRSEFIVETPARFAAGVFDRPVTEAEMAAANVTGNPLDEGYWDVFDDVEAAPEGLIIAWGAAGNAMGFFPGQESEEDDPLTGRFTDDQSWYFESQQPPYIWAAFWVESPANNFLSGRFFPGVMSDQ